MPFAPKTAEERAEEERERERVVSLKKHVFTVSVQGGDDMPLYCPGRAAPMVFCAFVWVSVVLEGLCSCKDR